VAKPAEMGSDDIVIVRKGGAKGVDPSEGAALGDLSVRQPSAPPQQQPEVRQEVATQGRAGEVEQLTRQPSRTAVIPDPVMTVAMISTPLRLPEPISERLRSMSFKTRRSKQEICVEFISKGLDDYWRSTGE
jgi:hypothetical protein